MSTSTVDDSVIAAGLLYSLANVNTVANCLTSDMRTFVSNVLRLPLSGMVSAVPYSNCRVCDYIPGGIQKIRGDGNCLFASLLVALGGAQQQADVLRQLIVNNMHNVHYPGQTLEVSLPRTDGLAGNTTLLAPSVEEYLRLSKMERDGVYGTDVEIYGFCCLTGLTVFVFHTLWGLWHVYRPPSLSSTCSIFIQQTRHLNHFETVITLQPKTNARFRETQLQEVTECNDSSIQIQSISNGIVGSTATSCSTDFNVSYSTLKHSKPRTLSLACEEDFPNRTQNTPESVRPFSQSFWNMTQNNEANVQAIGEKVQLPFIEVDSEDVCSSPGNLIKTRCDRSDEDPSIDTSTKLGKHIFPFESFDASTPNCDVAGSTTSLINLKLSDESEVHTTSASILLLEADTCSKCRRQPTLSHCFSIDEYNSSGFVRRHFGAPLRSSIVYLCRLCYEYCSSSTPKWRSAWPSVLYSLLSRKNLSVHVARLLCSYVPFTIRQHWFGVIGELNLTVKDSIREEKLDNKVIVDTTNRFRRFSKLIEKNTSRSIEKALDKEPYPNIRCVFGCWTFIEEDGVVPFQHLLNEIFPDLTSFQASFTQHLRGLCPYYFQTTVALNKFVVAASCRVDDKLGLVLHTCTTHSGGSHLQSLYPPLHPVLHRNASVHGERLAFVVPSLSTITNTKANYASHTYQLIKSVGSFSGISSIRLSNKRKWDVTCEITRHSEGFVSYFRKDARMLIRKWIAEGSLIQDVGDSILSYQPDSKSIGTALSLSSHVDLHTSFAMNKLFSTTASNQLNTLERFSVFCLSQTNNLHGSCLPTFSNTCSLGLWLLQIISAVSYSFRKGIVENNSITASLCARYLIKVFHIKNKFLSDDQKLLQQLEMFYESSISTVLPTTTLDSLHRASYFMKIVSPSIQHLPICQRTSVSRLFESINSDLVMLSAETSSRDKQRLPLSFHVHGRSYEMIMVGRDIPRGKSFVLSRYGGNHTHFWKSIRNKKFSEKLYDTPHEVLDTQIDRFWSFAVYRLLPANDTSDLRMQYMSSFAGQGRFFCEVHSTPLTRDYPKSGFKCKCGLKSFLRCPEHLCTAAVCFKHSKETLQNSSEQQFIRPSVAQKAETTGDNDNESACSSCSNLSQGDNDFALLTTGEFDVPLSEMVNVDNDDESIASLDHAFAHATDASQLPLTVDDDQFTDSEGILPIHILLNSECNLLRRRTPHPIYITAKQKRLLENLTACSPDMSIPLLQPEAMLFPSIFWSQHSDGSYDGAIPSGLFNKASFNQQLGFFGVEQMLVSRIKNGSSLCSSNIAYLQFVFDTILNLHLEQSDVRVVLNRGWQELKKPTSTSRVVDSNVFRMDNAESRKNVSEVAVFVKEYEPTWFFTYTCSQKTHPGLRKVFTAFEKAYPKEKLPKSEYLAAVHAEFMVLLRCWYRASQYVMRWITESIEQPLGLINGAWFRYEFQENTAGFPHIHALLSTGADVSSDAVRSKVCCSSQTFLGSINFLKPATLEAQNELVDLFERYQTHNCDKGQRRCQKQTERSDQPICRVPKYPPGVDFSYKPVPMNLSHSTFQLMQELNLAEVDPVTCTFKPILELQSGKHHYPANYHEHISPTNADVFALVRSSTNLQICDRNMSARYVAKYAAGIETRGFVKVNAGNSQDNVKVTTERVLNEKIAGVKFAIQKLNREARKDSGINGRILSVTESLWYVLDFPYVCTNLEFVHVPSTPKEYRSAIVIEKKRKVNPGFGVSFQEAERVRRNEFQLPSFRQLSTNQLLLLQDVQASDLSPDKITIFGLRPPELLFVDEVRLYFSWFVRSKLKAKKSCSVHSLFLKANYLASPWVDALGYRVLLRMSAVDDFVDFCGRQGHKTCYDDALNNLKKYILPNLRNRRFLNLFVSELPSHCKRNAITVFTNILPSNPVKFLVHFILSFGKFSTEIDLFTVANLKESFVVAGLFQPNIHEDGQVRALVRVWYMEQLRFIPGSLKLTDKYLPLAFSVMSEALLNNNLLFPFALPTILDRDVCEDYHVVLVSELAVTKQRLLDFLSTEVPSLPDINTIAASTLDEPCQWFPQITQQPHQADDSFAEQVNVLNELTAAIKKYTCGSYSFLRHHIIVGPPGTGKSFLLFNAVAFALCQGLNCIITSLAAERSASLNGKHINALIPFPVDKSATCDLLAKVALSRLQRDPTRSRYLECLDVLFIEEISMISSELWAAMDHVLQVICSNYVPFAGKLVIATGDFFQLPPPSGTSLIGSSFPITTFHFLLLQFFVRMQNEQGQELLRIIGKVPRSQESIDRAWEIIQNNCVFASSWEEVDVTSIRIFATRKAEREAIQAKIDEVRKSGSQYESVTCNDEMCTSSTNNWLEANVPVTKFLNRECLEPESLFVYTGAVMRLTINMPEHHVFQGQLCVVVDISEVLSNKSISVAFAPPGCREIPHLAAVISTWRVLKLRPINTAPTKFNYRTTCRRNQFPLKLFVASTIHKTMGETLPKVATQIVGGNHYSLWLSEQLYVIASRVRRLCDITFVGCVDQNQEAIKNLLTKQSQWALLTNAILNSITLSNVFVPQSDVHPFPSSAVPPPSCDTGFCYLLQSAPQPQHFYIGSTMSLKRRLREHNSGMGSNFTNVIARRPWILVAFVNGFSSNNSLNEIRHFEREWIQCLVNFRQLSRRNVKLEDAIAVVKDLILKWRCQHRMLTLIITSSYS